MDVIITLLRHLMGFWRLSRYTMSIDSLRESLPQSHQPGSELGSSDGLTKQAGDLEYPLWNKCEGNWRDVR